MRILITCLCFALIFSGKADPQADATRFAVEVRHAFIWGEDAPAGAVSSVIRDPLTGTELRRLKHDGVEVTSRIGFEKLHPEDVAEFIIYSITIVNNTKTELTVERGGIAIDGRLLPVLSVQSSIKAVNQRRSKSEKDVVNIGNLNCFASGYLSSETFFSSEGMSSTMLVQPQRSLSVSEIVRDPRYHSLLCSVAGCYPKGTFRYSIRVGSHEYIFPWAGSSVPNCGR
jgi:hypothetical protein